MSDRHRSETFTCPAAARWLPRVLGGAVLASALITSMRTDPAGLVASSGPFKVMLVLFAAVFSLWIVRKGSEVRLSITPGSEGIDFRHGRQARTLDYRDVVRIEHAPPLGPSRHWLPAVVLVDRFEQGWRIPAVVEGGERLLAALLAAAGRSDLDAWAEARGLDRKLTRGKLVTWVGYAFALVLLGSASIFYLVG